MNYAIGAVIFWVICGVLAYGMALAYLQREFPLVKCGKNDKRLALTLAVFGPIGLIAFLLSVLVPGIPFWSPKKHGFMWRIKENGK